ncbi:MAG: hypothetical protein HW406_546 [Candidatus Brocadiaceae bacterium]|nr:hypothetical protein [Candidatus Brocadiaceae bacterium]
MEKQPSSIMVYKRGEKYYCDVTGAFGGGYTGAYAGASVEEAALFALREKGGYITNNPKGGNMYLPKEVREWIEKEEKAGA